MRGLAMALRFDHIANFSLQILACQLIFAVRLCLEACIFKKIVDDP
jgi:hypothetical protein